MCFLCFYLGKHCIFFLFPCPFSRKQVLINTETRKLLLISYLKTIAKVVSPNTVLVFSHFRELEYNVDKSVSALTLSVQIENKNYLLPSSLNGGIVKQLARDNNYEHRVPNIGIKSFDTL